LEITIGIMNYELGIKNKLNKIVARRRYNSLFVIHNSRKSAGFTLFEMIVSLGIFSIAMLMILSSLLSITSAQKKAVTLQTVEDNLRFVIDSMSKEIRTGFDYDCGNTGAPNNCGNTNNNCVSAASSIAFVPARASVDKVIYEFDAVDKDIKKTEILADGGGTVGPYTITGSDITIDDLRFCVVGAGSANGLQPRATIMLRATSEIGADRTQSSFDVQTTVAQRKIDS